MEQKCVICLEKNADFAIIPCGHKCGCNKCLDKTTFCPICRAEKQNMFRIYISVIDDNDDNNSGITNVSQNAISDSTLKIYYSDLVWGSKAFDVLIPVTNDDANLFKKYSAYFSSMTLFTEGPQEPTAYITFFQNGEIKPFPKKLCEQLLADCEHERKNGVFKDEYPNSSVQFTNFPLKITPIRQREIEEYNVFNQNKRKRAVPEFTIDLNIDADAKMAYGIRYMYDGSVSYTNNL